MPSSVQLILHLAALVFLHWRLAAKLFSARADRLAAVGLLTWANLVYTGLALGAFERLDRRGLYVLLSVLGAAVPLLCLRWTAISPWTPPRGLDAGSVPSRFERLAERFFWGTWSLAVAGNLLLALAYRPGNWDTLVYRYPRALFYLGEGSLYHFPTGDSRLLWFPLAGPLLYLAFATHHVVNSSWMLVSLGNWILQGPTIWFAARRLGASRLAAIAAAWCGVMAPSLLVQAVSGNDDSLAATPLLLGLTFLIAWWRDGRLRFRLLLLGLAGVFLSLGTKPHFVFYWTTAVVVALMASRHWRRAWFVAKLLGTRWKHLLLASLATLPLFAGFLGFGYAATRRIGDSTTNMLLPVLVEPAAAAQTLGIFSLDLALRPLADLPLIADQERRTRYYEAWNEWVKSSVLAGFSPAAGATHAGDGWNSNRFETDRFYYEHSVSPGLLPWAFLAALLLATLVPRAGATWGLAFSASFFLWHCGFGLMHRIVSMQLGTYYAFPALVAAPAVAWLWDRARGESWPRRGVSGAVLALVVSTHCLTAINVFSFNTLRNLPSAFETRLQPRQTTHSDEFTAFVRGSKSLYVPYTHWAMQHWAYMRLNPQARYRTGLDRSRLEAGTTTVLLLHRWLSIAGSASGTLPVAVRLPDLARGEFAYAGTFLGGDIQAFARGGDARQLLPRNTGYAMIDLELEWNDAQDGLSGVRVVDLLGVPKAVTDLELKLDFSSSLSDLRFATPWIAAVEIRDTYPLAPEQKLDTVTILSRTSSQPEVVVANVRALAPRAVADWAVYETLGTAKTVVDEAPPPSERRTPRRQRRPRHRRSAND